MSLMDKIKSMFSGGSSDSGAHDHDHAGGDHSHEPVAPPMPPADPAGRAPDAAPREEGESRLD